MGVFSFSLYITQLFVLGHTPLSYMQWQIEGVPVKMFTNGRAITAMLLTPLGLLLDAIVLGVLLYMWPTPLDQVRWLRRMTKPSKVAPDTDADACASGETTDSSTLASKPLDTKPFRAGAP